MKCALILAVVVLGWAAAQEVQTAQQFVDTESNAPTSS
jgi:hypothetical protein